jgi:hypothetical protein
MGSIQAKALYFLNRTHLIQTALNTNPKSITPLQNQPNSLQTKPFKAKPSP